MDKRCQTLLHLSKSKIQDKALREINKFAFSIISLVFFFFFAFQIAVWPLYLSVRHFPKTRSLYFNRWDKKKTFVFDLEKPQYL